MTVESTGSITRPWERARSRNAIALAKAVPAGTRLHLLTHSRGGLVAEVLARVAAKPDRHVRTLQGEGLCGPAREELRQLAKIVADKRIKVERVVRVACPARGTLLASKRLDAYVSVVKWALELAGVPVVPELVGFLGEVARRRADPDLLPGLAAQIPDSPLVQWLHDHGDADCRRSPCRCRRSSGRLGHRRGSRRCCPTRSTGPTTISSCRRDRCMAERRGRSDSTFVLDQGGKVSHFNYFSNAETATAIVDALVRDTPDGFRVIGPLSWGGTSSTGVRAALVQRAPAAAAALPAAVRAPGHPREQSEGRERSHLARLAPGQRVRPAGV